MQNKKNYNPWEDIVMAMLSTGGYRLEKTYKHRELLIVNGLTDLHKISSMGQKNIARKLVESGYNRGPVLTAMFTKRLLSLGKLSNKMEENEQVLTEGSKEEISFLLKNVNGVGPVVIDMFLVLRDSK